MVVYQAITSLTSDNSDIQIDGENAEKVNEFVFLGSLVPDTTKYVERRINLALSAFGRLSKQIWRNAQLSLNIKVRLYNALILPIATYASETWTLKESDNQKLLVFEMKCLRAILGVSLHNRLRNERIRKRLSIEKTIVERIRLRRIKWFGHVNRRNPESALYKAYRGDFSKRRPKGRPPKRWSDQIRADTGLPLRTAERQTMDREEWRRRVRLRARDHTV